MRFHAICMEPKSYQRLVLRGNIGRIARKDAHVAGVALACLAIGSGWAAYSIVKTTDYCLPQSGSPLGTLFAPCQAFKTTIARTVIDKEIQLGLLTADEQPVIPSIGQPAVSPTYPVTEKDQSDWAEHATVGVVRTRSAGTGG